MLLWAAWGPLWLTGGEAGLFLVEVRDEERDCSREGLLLVVAPSARLESEDDPFSLVIDF